MLRFEIPRTGRPIRHNGILTMENETIPRVRIQTRVWRDLGQLAAEAAMIGVVFSLLLAIAVFVMARDNHGDAARPVAVSPTAQGAGTRLST
jgi:hypothetical protein